MNNFEEVKNWLLCRTISEEILKKYNISWNGKIIIPVYDESGKFLFNKYRRSPITEIGDKYLYDVGSKATLFGTQFIDKTQPVILCEGELDCLALVSHGFQAVSSTGGCKTFKDEWIPWFTMPVFICYDIDTAGREGALMVHYKIPGSKIINLPVDKDVTDYFILGNKKEDFRKLILGAVEFPKPKIKHVEFKKSVENFDNVKRVPITDFIHFDEHNKTRCIWHNEKTPSLNYYPQKNDCFCFGCGRYFDVIDVVRQIKGLGFREAVDFLKKNY